MSDSSPSGVQLPIHSESSLPPPVVPGTERVMEQVKEHLWRDPEGGQLYARSPLSGAVIPTGHHPKSTKNTKAGRKPDVWKGYLRELLTDPAVLAKYANIATGPDDKLALRAILGASRAVSPPPPQAVDVSERIQIFVGDGKMGYQLLAEEVEEGEAEEIEEIEEGELLKCVCGNLLEEDDGSGFCENCRKEAWGDE